jgi:hypothetical protein
MKVIPEIISIFIFIHTTSCCFYTSFLFIINFVSCILYKQYKYASIFMCLIMTSMFFHLTGEGFFLDQISIYMLSSYGFYIFYSKKKTITTVTIPVITFLIVFYLFCYGYFNQCYCYGKYGNEYHSLLHLLTCIGHLSIVV